MPNQLFESDIEKMTVSMLKEVLNINDWPSTGLRLKAEFKEQILMCSYKDAQLKGIREMSEAR